MESRDWATCKKQCDELHDVVRREMKEEIALTQKKLDGLKQELLTFDSAYLQLMPTQESVSLFEGLAESFIDKEKKHTTFQSWMDRFKAQQIVRKGAVLELHHVLLLKDFDRFTKELRAGKQLLSLTMDFDKCTFEAYVNAVHRIQGEISVNFKNWFRYPS